MGDNSDDTTGADAGAVYLFKRSSGLWMPWQKITPSDPSARAFGLAVELSGQTLVTGAPFNAGTLNYGAAFVYAENDGLWSEQQKLAVIDVQANKFYGWSVGISGDDVIVGAPFVHCTSCPPPGYAYLYHRSGVNWVLQNTLVASDPVFDQQFGCSVAIDRGAMIVGAPRDNERGYAAGAAYIFEPDTQPPVIAGIRASPAVLSPANHKLVPVTLTVDATDNAGMPICRIISVQSSEPEESRGDGNTDPDWEITGDLTLNLRAERSSQGPGRVYTIIVECRDAAGNVTRGTTAVAVPRR